jgi:hypothetical protein
MSRGELCDRRLRGEARSNAEFEAILKTSGSPPENPEQIAPESKDLLSEISLGWSEATFQIQNQQRGPCGAELEAIWRRLSRQPKS